MSNITKTFQEGEIIIHKGDPALNAFLVLKGRVTVYLEKGARVVTLADLKIGSIFGESALFQDGKDYGAYVKAVEETEVAVITPEDFKEKLQGCDPMIQTIIRTIIERQRHTNATLLARETQEYMELDLVDAEDNQEQIQAE